MFFLTYILVNFMHYVFWHMFCPPPGWHLVWHAFWHILWHSSWSILWHILSQFQRLGNLVSNEVRWCTQSPYRVVLRRNWHNHLETFTWKVGKNMKTGRDRKIKGWNMSKINNRIRAVGWTPMRKYLSQMTGECSKHWVHHMIIVNYTWLRLFLCK